ncbi:zinc finger matrin-type protein 1 isoform X2 [Syngnathoides biaculeatus]|uniref:zinc finger matrin-type protein 1 isoform X2 n=1 Tax=Syngnathoides biaculeatus TaxID=300417 RepID=UPI002ADD4B82|nr:zinc finger matrin-type protein 1 isoform X2 [Syngnathoides biaculeatus]
MDLLNVSTPQFVESGAQNNIGSAPLATFATDPDKVINIKTDSTQVGGSVNDEELLKGLLTDQHCHVCEAVLLFESHRLSHYQGKKHAQKLKLYLHNKRDEMRCTDSAGLLHCMPTDKDRFCELCSMVFTSPVVAKSHYEGKVHAKNLRKQSLQKPEQNTEVSILPSSLVDRPNEDHISGSVNNTELATNSNVASSDPNKYCVLCEASFNNPQMALQHYNGRKHQRKKARQEMFKELEHVHEGNTDSENPLSCAICNLQFNSVEMYQAHMQGNKHHKRKKKVFKVCKSREKSYSTFTDELAHYIEVQKARGLSPKIGQTLSKTEPQKGGGQVETPPSCAPHFTVEGFQPQYMGPPWPSSGWDSYRPQSFADLEPLPESGARPLKRDRKYSSSSSYSSASSSSISYSSFTSSGASDGKEGERRQRQRRTTKGSRRERGSRSKAASSDKARRRQQKRPRNDHSEERRDDNREPGKEERRKKCKYHSKEKWQGRKLVEEKVKDSVAPPDMMQTRHQTEGHVQPNNKQEQHTNVTFKRDKKKTKMIDNRTEEERLWDDSILGC